jgi:predicted DsbA family dithiol-disulfide isomerase
MNLLIFNSRVVIMKLLFGAFCILLLLFSGCTQTNTAPKLLDTSSKSIDNTKYVCANGSIVSTPVECNVKNDNNSHNVTIHPGCDDGTEVAKCSEMKPEYCNIDLQLVPNSSKCGCPDGYEVKYNDCILHSDKCTDGTLNGKCSSYQPRKCVNGTLVNAAKECGCPSGFIPSGDACINPAKPPQEQSKPLQALTVSFGTLPPLGNESAQVSIVVFTDFQCPYCGKLYNDAEAQIRADYINSDKVKLYWRDFPQSFHPNANSAANAARCANEQGKFWDMHDMLFSTQSNWSGLSDTGPTFKGYASILGLKSVQFSSCYDSEVYAGQIDADILQGQSYEVGGTPSIFIIIPKSTISQSEIQESVTSLNNQYGAGVVLYVNPDTYVVLIPGAFSYSAFDSVLSKVDYSVAANSSNLTHNNSTITICNVVYDPPGKEPDEEMIEICNYGLSEVNIGGWKLTDGEGDYFIPAETKIAPNSSWKVFGITYNPTGFMGGLALSNTHDSVTLSDSNGTIIDEKIW